MCFLVIMTGMKSSSQFIKISTTIYPNEYIWNSIIRYSNENAVQNFLIWAYCMHLWSYLCTNCVMEPSNNVVLPSKRFYICSKRNLFRNHSSTYSIILSHLKHIIEKKSIADTCRNWHSQDSILSASSLWIRKDDSHDSKAEKRDKFLSDSPPAAHFGRRVKQKHSWGYEANRLTQRSSWKFVASFDLVPVPEPGNGRGGGGELKDQQIRWGKICISMLIVACLLMVLTRRHMRGL